VSVISSKSFGRPEADIRALVPRIDVPVFTAWGTGDRVTQLARCRPALDRLPRHTLAAFASRHAAHLECLDAFAAALATFVRDAGVP
jgi:pimeloyl-ACP methyl ester carboxylesterase